MATNTTNFDLVKPAGSDNYDIDSFHNGSMDKIDSALQGLGTGLAIISKNNTHGAISSGEYVYVHGHGSLAEGLYKANTNIAANGTLTSSNLTAVSGGLGAHVASLSNQIAIKNVPISRDTSTTSAGAFIGKKVGNIIGISLDVTVSSSSSGWQKVGEITDTTRPQNQYYGQVVSLDGVSKPAIVTLTGEVKILAPTTVEYFGQFFCV